MRMKLVAVLLGLGLVAAASPSFACPYHDQQAATDTQQTAQAAGDTRTQ